MMKGYTSEYRGKIEQYAKWRATPEEERTIKTQKEFAESIGVEEHTLVRWGAQLAETDAEDEITKFREHLYKLAMRPSATAKHMELYARLKGLLDKSVEDTHKIDGSYLAREILRVRRGLEDRGMAVVRREPPALR